MRRTLRYLLLAIGAGLSALAVIAVHGAATLPLAVAVYADVVLGLCWLAAATLLLRSRRAPDTGANTGGEDAPGPRDHRAVRYSTDGEPLARSHRGTRHRR
ncbi:hypothetical protein ACIQPT_32610 [Streptomyces sp. NPDC091289]|uniref:hypothetical protein n=1 Tax=Streptomyces sp. NPDC091289 TaxID=3365989 RepID=UPI0038301367